MALFCDVNLFFSTKPIFPNFSATHVRLICCVFLPKMENPNKTPNLYVMTLILVKLEPNRNNGAKNIAHPVFIRKNVKCDVTRKKKALRNKIINLFKTRKYLSQHKKKHRLTYSISEIKYLKNAKVQSI